MSIISREVTPNSIFDSQSALQQYYNHVSHAVRYKTLPYTGINLNSKTSIHSWQFSMDATENYDFAVGNQTFEYYKRPNVTAVVPWAGPNRAQWSFDCLVVLQSLLSKPQVF